jgi:autotransporter-associated beta strand protein
MRLKRVTSGYGIRLRAVLLASAALCAVAAGSARAQDATWLSTPGSADFNTAANWSPAAVPTGTAFFNTSSVTSLSFSATTTFGGWTFNPGAAAYTFTMGQGASFQVVSFNGAGIVINGGSASLTNGSNGFLQFFNASTAGSASIIANGGLSFNNISTAGSASIITNNGMIFHDSSTAGNSTITNNNGHLIFASSSTAGSATITANSGGGSHIEASSSGGTARFILNGTGFLDISALGAGTGGATAGSIEGAGNVFLGAKNLAVGGNNLSTPFSGVIQDGSIFGGTGPGSLTKTGSGTLTLSNTETYTGATTVNGGTLAVNGSILSSSGVTVNSGGTLAGTGIVGNTTINGGTLAPGSNASGALNVLGSLMFTAAATYMVQESATNASSTNVTGTATLAGTVQVTSPTNSFRFNSPYTILTSGGRGGTQFGGLVLPTGMTGSLIYSNANDVQLTLIHHPERGRRFWRQQVQFPRQQQPAVGLPVEPQLRCQQCLSQFRSGVWEPERSQSESAECRQCAEQFLQWQRRHCAGVRGADPGGSDAGLGRDRDRFAADHV